MPSMLSRSADELHAPLAGGAATRPGGVWWRRGGTQGDTSTRMSWPARPQGQPAADGSTVARVLCKRWPRTQEGTAGRHQSARRNRGAESGPAAPPRTPYSCSPRFPWPREKEEGWPEQTVLLGVPGPAREEWCRPGNQRGCDVRRPARPDQESGRGPHQPGTGRRCSSRGGLASASGAQGREPGPSMSAGRRGYGPFRSRGENNSAQTAGDRNRLWTAVGRRPATSTGAGRLCRFMTGRTSEGRIFVVEREGRGTKRVGRRRR